MKPLVITRKIGRNRGNARLWIEGSCLENAGWNTGSTFERIDSPGTITLRRNPAGPRKVAGTPGRPIIDTNSNSLLSALGVALGETVSISITQESITITKA